MSSLSLYHKLCYPPNMVVASSSNALLDAKNSLTCVVSNNVLICYNMPATSFLVPILPITNFLIPFFILSCDGIKVIGVIRLPRESNLNKICLCGFLCLCHCVCVSLFFWVIFAFVLCFQ